MGLFDFLFGKKQAPSVQAVPENSSPEEHSTFLPRTSDLYSSEPHQLLLSRFLSAQNAENAAPPYWEDVLGEPPQCAVNRFLSDGLLVHAKLNTKLDRAFNVAELKPFLNERRLRVSGRKAELIERLVCADTNGMEAKVAGLNIFECSPRARPMAEQYVAAKKAEKEAVAKALLSFLRIGDFAAAARCNARYCAKQVFSPGLGIDWSNDDPIGSVRLLTIMFSARPQILKGLAEEEWQPLRIAAGMMSFWGTNKATEWLPDGFVGVPKFDADTTARMLLFHAQNERHLAQLRDRGVKRGTVRGLGTASCAACQKLNGKTMPIDKIPELPYAGCTEEIGCRCHVAAESDHEATLDKGRRDAGNRRH